MYLPQLGTSLAYSALEASAQTKLDPWRSDRSQTDTGLEPVCKGLRLVLAGLLRAGGVRDLADATSIGKAGFRPVHGIPRQSSGDPSADRPWSPCHRGAAKNWSSMAATRLPASGTPSNRLSPMKKVGVPFTP